MPHINELKESRFLKKEDVGEGALMTIKSVEQINVAKEGAPEDMKWCYLFEETDKPMVSNSTNNQIIARIVGNDLTENWPGHKIVLFNDPNVSYAGKITGGIRVRAPRNQAAKPAQTAPKPSLPPADEETPF